MKNKVASLLLVNIIAIVSVLSFSIQAAAYNFNNAKELESDVAVNYSIKGEKGWASIISYGKMFSIDVTDTGEFSLFIDVSGVDSTKVHFFNEGGNLVEYSHVATEIGSTNENNLLFEKETISLFWSKGLEKYEGTIYYPVSRGKYYIYIEGTKRYGEDVDRDYMGLSLVPSFPAKVEEVTLNYFSINMKAGNTITIGAIVSKAGDSVSYESSNPQIVTVSSAGKIKAKKKGSCIIKVSYGSSVKKLKITVRN